MMNSIRLKAKKVNGITKVKILVSHPMHTGLMRDKKTGKKIPAHYITEVVCLHNESEVFKALWGIAISRNPYLSFTLKDINAGDELTINWKDNLGNTGSKVFSV